MLVVTPTLDDLVNTLSAFIQTVLPTADVPVIALPPNRASPPPPEPGYVGVTLMRQGRIMTNVDDWARGALDPQTLQILQAVKIAAQLDCYSARASEWATILSGVLRDEYAIRPLKPFAPLYTDEPIRAPITSAEEQYEDRWIVTAYLQYNPIVSVPQQFARVAKVGLINVDVGAS